MTAPLLTSVETQIKAHVHTKIQISMSQGIFIMTGLNPWSPSVALATFVCEHVRVWERERQMSDQRSALQWQAAT